MGAILASGVRFVSVIHLQLKHTADHKSACQTALMPILKIKKEFGHFDLQLENRTVVCCFLLWCFAALCGFRNQSKIDCSISPADLVTVAFCSCTTHIQLTDGGRFSIRINNILETMSPQFQTEIDKRGFSFPAKNR